MAPEQKTELAAEVATGRFRTAAEIRRWVEERWGVRYTEGGMYALLKRLRCAPKVPRLCSIFWSGPLRCSGMAHP